MITSVLQRHNVNFASTTTFFGRWSIFGEYFA